MNLNIKTKTILCYPDGIKGDLLKVMDRCSFDFRLILERKMRVQTYL